MLFGFRNQNTKAIIAIIQRSNHKLNLKQSQRAKLSAQWVTVGTPILSQMFTPLLWSISVTGVSCWSLPGPKCPLSWQGVPRWRICIARQARLPESKMPQGGTQLLFLVYQAAPSTVSVSSFHVSKKIQGIENEIWHMKTNLDELRGTSLGGSSGLMSAWSPSPTM